MPQFLFRDFFSHIFWNVQLLLTGPLTCCRELCCEYFISHWVSWIPAEQVSSSGSAPCCLEKEISEYRKCDGRNYSFKLLPLWDFREAITASDNLFVTEPNKIKDLFPSLCLPINLRLLRSLLGICVDFFSLEPQSNTQVIIFIINWQTMTESHK